MKKHEIKPIRFLTPDITATLRKRNLENLVDELKDKQQSLSNIERKLANDRSRTKMKALIDSRKEAKRLINAVDEPFLKAQKEKQSIIDDYLDKVAKERQIKGTTDLLIMQNYLPIFEKKSDILELAKVDVEAARAALLLPAVKHKFGLDDTHIARIKDSLTRHVLGDDYSNLMETTADQEAILSVRDSIFSDYEKTDNELFTLMEGVVELGGEGTTMN